MPENLPGPIHTPPCICLPDDVPCLCTATERCLRGWAVLLNPPMTQEQRTWCLEEIKRCGDSTHQNDRFRLLGDSSLADQVIYAWRDYARDKGLL